MQDRFANCHTIMWYDQYCENYFSKGFKAYSAEAVLHDLDTIDADIVALYAANQWGLAYYKSAVIPQSIGLDGRDYFGEVLAGLKARGKKVIAYINWLDSRHPQWRMQRLSPSGLEQLHTDSLEPLPYYDKQGFDTVYKLHYGEWFNHCLISPRREEVLRLAEEIVSRYPDLDGFHMDMFFNYGVCGCERCQPRLQKITSSENPTYLQVLEHWDECLAWRQEESTHTVAAMAEIVHKAGMAFAPNSFCPIYLSPTMAVSPGWWPHQDFYVTEAWLRLSSGYADAHSTTVVSKWLRAIDKPSALLVTGQHPEFSHAPLCAEEYRLHAASCLANGAPVLGSCGQGAYPSTASNAQALRTMHEIFGEYSRRMDTLPERKSLARIAILWSQDSRDYFEPGENTLQYRFEFLGYCRALLEGHYLFDIIIPEKLLSPDDLAPYAFIILPDAACIDKGTAELIRVYVAQGGKILASWETGWRDERGRRRQESLLADVLGVSFRSIYPSGTIYAERLPEPCLVYGSACVVEPTCAITLLRYAAPDPDYPAVGTGVDLVPGLMTDNPFLTINRYEAGEAWYVSASLGYSAYKSGYYQMNELLGEIFSSAGLPCDVDVQAPVTIEFNAEQDKAGNLYLHFGNQTVPAYHPGKAIDRSIDQFIPVHDIRVTLHRMLDKRNVQCSAGEVTIEAGDGTTTLILPAVKDYLLVKILAK
ncbi:MAG: beta-galactosidase trimerization domain-containing protein [Chloroflexi bacterium]|nr:beta-galactosidase trimerization domain-containing protein [Chloroflexota bacterium]